MNKLKRTHKKYQKLSLLLVNITGKEQVSHLEKIV